MGNLHRAMACGATAQNFSFGGLTVTPKPQVSKEKNRFEWLPPLNFFLLE